MMPVAFSYSRANKPTALSMIFCLLRHKQFAFFSAGDSLARRPNPFFSTQASDELPHFMNGPVRNLLGIIPTNAIWRTSKLDTNVLE